MKRTLWIALCVAAAGLGALGALMIGSPAPEATALPPVAVDPDAGLELYRRMMGPTLVTNARELPSKVRENTTPSKVVEGPSLLVAPDYEQLGLGTVRQWTTETRSVTLTNVGTEPLSVHRTVADCGCAQVLIERPNEPIAAGSSRKAVLKFAFGGRSAGDYRRKVSIYTNDPARPRYVLPVQFRLVAAIRSDPQLVDFGEHDRGSEAKVQVTLIGLPDSDDDWSVVSVRSPKQNLGTGRFEFEFTPKYRTGENGERICELTLTHPSIDRIGGYHKPLSIETTHPKLRIVTVPSSIRVTR